MVMLARPFAMSPLPKIAHAAERLEIVEECLTAFAPRRDVIDVELNARLNRRTCSA